MNIASLRGSIPDFGRDIRLNLENVLTEEGAPGLTRTQIFATALSCAYVVDSKELVQALLADGQLDDTVVEATRAAATIMAMNNVYYRSQHLLNDPELKNLPAKLRMTIFGRPGVPKLDFELMSFAISALAGCGQCLTAHLAELRKAGLSDVGAQSAIRIASVIRAADQALRIKDLSASIAG